MLLIYLYAYILCINQVYFLGWPKTILKNLWVFQPKWLVNFLVILATWAVVDLNFDCATTRESSPLICLCTPQNSSERTTVRGNVSQPEIKSAKTWIFRVAEIVGVLRWAGNRWIIVILPTCHWMPFPCARIRACGLWVGGGCGCGGGRGWSSSIIHARSW